MTMIKVREVKNNLIIFMNFRGKFAYYLRNSAKLRRERKAPNEFELAYNLFG